MNITKVVEESRVFHEKRVLFLILDDFDSLMDPIIYRIATLLDSTLRFGKESRRKSEKIY